jgi:hypothetical protein
MPKKKKKQRQAIGIFLLIVGVATILTFVFYILGDSYVEGKYEGFFFSGTVAIFIGLFLILLKGFKTIYTFVVPSIVVLLLVGTYFYGSPMLNSSNGNSPNLRRQMIMMQHIDSSFRHILPQRDSFQLLDESRVNGIFRREIIHPETLHQIEQPIVRGVINMENMHIDTVVLRVNP